MPCKYPVVQQFLDTNPSDIVAMEKNLKSVLAPPGGYIDPLLYWAILQKKDLHLKALLAIKAIRNYPSTGLYFLRLAAEQGNAPIFNILLCSQDILPNYSNPTHWWQHLSNRVNYLFSKVRRGIYLSDQVVSGNNLEIIQTAFECETYSRRRIGVDERYQSERLRQYTLILAARSGDLTLVQTLLPPPTTEWWNGYSLQSFRARAALSVAIQSGHLEIMKVLLDTYEPRTSEDWQDEKEIYPRLALQTCNSELVNELFRRGHIYPIHALNALENAIRSENMTTLTYLMGSPRIVELIETALTRCRGSRGALLAFVDNIVGCEFRFIDKLLKIPAINNWYNSPFFMSNRSKYEVQKNTRLLTKINAIPEILIPFIAGLTAIPEAHTQKEGEHISRAYLTGHSFFRASVASSLNERNHVVSEAVLTTNAM